MTDSIPADVIRYLRQVMANCNSEVTAKLSRNPNLPEQSFDTTWVDELAKQSAATEFDSGWVVKIEVHFLGGLSHFGSWEIADVGMLVHLHLRPGDVRSKVALLQSKRLYPVHGPVREETRTDYVVGFGRLADPEDASVPIGIEREFRFTDESRYAALQVPSRQARLIENYQEQVGFTVYYQLYNPWTIPFTQRIPIQGYTRPAGAPDVGVRIVPTSVIHPRVVTPARTPSYADLRDIAPLPSGGWRLEDFVCDEVLGCREGNKFVSIGEPAMDELFNRRSGPIAAAVAVTIESPEVLEGAEAPEIIG